MKTIGQTVEGKVLVEMTQDEHQEFCYLQQVVDGAIRPTAFVDDRSRIPEGNLAGTFGAIRAFAMTRGRLNGLRDILNLFAAELDKKASPPVKI